MRLGTSRGGIRTAGHVSGLAVLACAVLGGLVALAVWPGLVTDADPRDCSLSRSLQPPSRDAPFGFDLQGCDYLAQTVHGARTSLVIAGLVVMGTAAVAVVLASAAGMLGGWVDTLLTRATDVWSGIPLVLGGVILLAPTDDRGPAQVVLVLTVFGWPPMARVLRASVLEARAADYVTAAAALGASRWRLLRRHVLPAAVRPLLVFSSTYAGVVVAAEATLTFVGSGLQRPTESWGILLHQAQDRIAAAPHLLVFPAAFLTLTVLGFVLLGEALRDSRPR